MKHSLIYAAVLAAVLPAMATVTYAADKDRASDQDRTQTTDQARDQDQVYSSQLMTTQERNEYRARMRSAKTVEEQKQVRNEHHERMKVRAKERGVTLPDEMPAQGKGRGMGPGTGSGMGPGMGGGMGPGGGKR